MNTFLALTANELMTTDVLTVYEGWSIKRLTDFFIKHRITGAPVIASDHELVGVVSVADIIQFDHLPDTDKATLIAENVYMEFVGQTLFPSDIKSMVDHALENCTVNSIMTPEIISVSPTDSIKDVASLMYQCKIHRVFVAEKGVILGVVSAGDILAQIAQITP